MIKLHVRAQRPKLPTYLAISHSSNYIALNSHSVRTWNSGRDHKPTHYNSPGKKNLANAQKIFSKQQIFVQICSRDSKNDKLIENSERKTNI